jgi:anaerobic magnesium-protoporphyrin IX monomethyl ester cyclase
MTPAPPTKGPWIHGRRFVPIGLAYVAAALEKSGFQVQMLDNYMLEKPIEEVKADVAKLNPEIVGITCSSVTYSRVIETAKAVKDTVPSCTVVVGGWHASYNPESLLQNPEVDYVVMGEGERAMVQLATYLIKGENENSPSKIAGLAYRHEGKIVKNPRQFITNMDEIPFPAWHLLPIDRYNRVMEYLNVKPVDNMSIARGCPFSCAFCETTGLMGRTCRTFTPQRVLDEIKYLMANFGTKGIYFINDNFTIKKKETIELCQLIRQNKLGLEWVCDTRADLLSKELLQEMKAAGCKTIWFGVESGSPRILEKINKGVTLEQTEHAFDMCKKEGIQTACSFLLGIPGETVDDMKASFKFARKLDPDFCRFNIFIAVPGSPLYDEVMQNHLYDQIEDYAAYVKTADFNYDSLLKIQRQFHMSFNKSPKRILHKMKREGFWTTLKKTPMMLH